jgi:hypothetical protein
VWITPRAQRRANVLCAAFGVLLALVSIGAWGGFALMSEETVHESRLVEDQIFNAKVESGILNAEEAAHKRGGRHDEDAQARSD